MNCRPKAFVLALFIHLVLLPCGSWADSDLLQKYMAEMETAGRANQVLIKRLASGERVDCKDVKQKEMIKCAEALISANPVTRAQDIAHATNLVSTTINQDLKLNYFDQDSAMILSSTLLLDVADQLKKEKMFVSNLSTKSPEDVLYKKYLILSEEEIIREQLAQLIAHFRERKSRLERMQTSKDPMPLGQWKKKNSEKLLTRSKNLKASLFSETDFEISPEELKRYYFMLGEDLCQLNKEKLKCAGMSDAACPEKVNQYLVSCLSDSSKAKQAPKDVISKHKLLFEQKVAGALSCLSGFEKQTFSKCL